MGIHLIEATLLLLFLTTIAVPWARRTGLPTEILLVLGSLALSLLPGLPPLILDPAVVFTLFLPPILFSAAYFTSWRDFKQNRRPIFLLAFGLVLFIVQIGDTYVPRTPLTDKATATGVWVFYSLFVLIAFAVEKIGARTKSNTR